MKNNKHDAILITCFYNPCGWKSRLSNYHRFIDSLPPSVPHRTIELSIDGSPFYLDDSCMRLTSKSWFWHKERLLNILSAQCIADGYKKIVWCDADIQFLNNEFWWEDTCDLLSHYKVVQPFETCSHVESKWDGRTPSSTAAFCKQMKTFGHPGFACGMTAEVWSHKLSEYGIRGSGDTLFMSALLEADGAAHRRACNLLPAWETTFESWRKRLCEIVNRETDVAFTANTHAHHFWGGSIHNRQYASRYKSDLFSSVVPGVDISIVDPHSNDTVEWISERGKECEQEFKNIMWGRNEDDPMPRPSRWSATVAVGEGLIASPEEWETYKKEINKQKFLKLFGNNVSRISSGSKLPF